MTGNSTAAGRHENGGSREALQQQESRALSKLISASIGEIAVVFARSPATRGLSLADMEWMVVPPVLAGQAYIAEATDKTNGFSAPVAAITWARVSAEVDQRLVESPGPQTRLAPSEWTSGDIYWLVHVGGEPQVLDAALRHCAETIFKDKPVKFRIVDRDGTARVTFLHDLITVANEVEKR